MIRLAEDQPFFGCKFNGRTFDCGSKIGFLAANIVYALDRPDLSADLLAEIRSLLAEHQE
jgi:UTP--glucose-1-phosphate uridylyltransferase